MPHGDGVLTPRLQFHGFNSLIKRHSGDMATIEDFEKIDIRVGKIVTAEDFPEAKKPAYKLRIDFGELGVRSSSARITHLYTKEELAGKLVVCVTNLSPRKVGRSSPKFSPPAFVGKMALSCSPSRTRMFRSARSLDSAFKICLRVKVQCVKVWQAFIVGRHEFDVDDKRAHAFQARESIDHSTHAA
jgi:export-related chaperone CsaA